MIFGMRNPEKIWHKSLTHCPPRLSDVAAVPWEIEKVIFNSIIHTYFWLFMLSHKKTICNPLAHPPKNVITLTCELQNFFVWLMFVAFFQTLEALKRPNCGLSSVALKEPVVMCGSCNVRQAMSQQVFRVTTFCINTCFQSFSTMYSHAVHHAMLKFSPHCNKPLPASLNTSISIHALLL